MQGVHACGISATRFPAVYHHHIRQPTTPTTRPAHPTCALLILCLQLAALLDELQHQRVVLLLHATQRRDAPLDGGGHVLRPVNLIHDVASSSSSDNSLAAARGKEWGAGNQKDKRCVCVCVCVSPHSVAGP